MRINSSERCWYEIVEFEISDDLYAKINEAVENNIPLADCDFADELYELAVNFFLSMTMKNTKLIVLTLLSKKTA